MSKVNNAFFMMSLVVLCVVFYTGTSLGQNIEASIKVNVEKASISIRGQYLGRGSRSLSFLKSGVGESDLKGRISNLGVTDETSRPIPYKQSNKGEFVAETDFVRWGYELMAAVSKNSRAAAHISWLSDKNGILMLDDLLPHSSNRTNKISATVTIDVPAGWKVVSTEKRTGLSTFHVADIEKAVFLIGTDLREIKSNNSAMNITASGQWLFTDAEFSKIADEIYKEYLQIFGSGPADKVQVAIMPFPQKDVPTGTWEAETRGRSVTIISADMPFKTQSPQRLHEQLRHEIFHLWLPNGVNLSGNYDWFYEGFALYQSLKTGVALNQIRFEDFLDTLSRAHNIDSTQQWRRSLIEASQNRWNGADTQVYARGMLTAFLSDLALIQNSKGKTSISDIFQKLYDSHKPPNPPSDANTAILKILDSYPQLKPVADRYVRGSRTIDWRVQLDAAGIENEAGNSGTSLRVQAKLTGSQKVILDKLGYNNWRKLSRKP